MQKASDAFKAPIPKKFHTTQLWALAEEVARITGTTPKRWLRYGDSTLRRALIYLKEKPNVQKRAAFLTWAVKYYAAGAGTDAAGAEAPNTCAKRPS